MGSLRNNKLRLAALLLIVTGCQETILHDLDESRANNVLLALANAGIETSKVREGNFWNIAVESSVASKALASLEGSRVLRDNSQRLPVNSSSLISSREERAHFLERSLALQLEQTLERLPGVLEARVHLFLDPQASLSLTPKAERNSASVLTVIRAGAKIEVEKVRALVGGASGIEPQSVKVVIASADVDSEIEQKTSKAVRPNPKVLPGMNLPQEQAVAKALTLKAASSGETTNIDSRYSNRLFLAVIAGVSFFLALLLLGRFLKRGDLKKLKRREKPEPFLKPTSEIQLEQAL